MWVFVNDRFVPSTEATISVFDHGFLYGDGVYETIRSYGARLFVRDLHLARLRRSADAIGLEIPIPEKDWPALLHEAMAKNAVGTDAVDAYLRVTVSRGPGEIGLDPALCQKATVVIMAKPLRPYPSHLYEKGVRVVVAQTRRNHPAALSPQIKSTSFLNNILAKREAVAAGAFDALLLNWREELAECTVSNLFFVRDGRLCTPSLDCGILDGITREIVLLLARERRLPVEEGRFHVPHLLEADECFLTNTSMALMPVTTLDNQPIGTGEPGPITLSLRDFFDQALCRFLEPALP
jgi:branched-chain amino acid aminotransferase